MCRSSTSVMNRAISLSTAGGSESTIASSSARQALATSVEPQRDEWKMKPEGRNAVESFFEPRSARQIP